MVSLTAKKLEEFQERSLAEFTPFAIFLDTIHRGGEAFLAKPYRKEAHKKLTTALEQTIYADAKQMLLEIDNLNKDPADRFRMGEALLIH